MTLKTQIAALAGNEEFDDETLENMDSEDYGRLQGYESAIADVLALLDKHDPLVEAIGRIQNLRDKAWHSFLLDYADSTLELNTEAAVQMTVEQLEAAFIEDDWQSDHDGHAYDRHNEWEAEDGAYNKALDILQALAHGLTL